MNTAAGTRLRAFGRKYVLLDVTDGADLPYRMRITSVSGPSDPCSGFHGPQTNLEFRYSLAELINYFELETMI